MFKALLKESCQLDKRKQLFLLRPQCKIVVDFPFVDNQLFRVFPLGTSSGTGQWLCIYPHSLCSLVHVNDHA